MVAVPIDGRITSQNILNLPLTGGEVMEIVSPGTAAAGNTYQVSTAVLRAFMSAWSNATTAVTSTYLVQSTDNGNTIALGGGAFYTVSFGPPAGYASTFTVVVLNKDAGRGKTISLSGGATFILWPLQSIIVFNQGGAWQTIGRSQWFIPVSQNFFIDPINGNDNNDGLATTAGAFKTLQGAFNTVTSQLNFNGNTVNLNAAHGTYSSFFSETAAWSGNGSLAFIGDAASPASVIVDGGVNSAFLVAGSAPGAVTISGFHVQSTSNSGIVIGEHNVVNILNIEYGNVAFGHLVCGSGADLAISGNCSVVGNAVVHMFCSQGGSLIRSLVTNTVTIVGSPLINIWAFASENSAIESLNQTFVGAPAAGCARFEGTLNAVINTNNQGPAYFPGDTAGILVTGAQYDALTAPTSRVTYNTITVNFNSTNTDTSIPILLPGGAIAYQVASIRIGHASASISTATWGLFSAVAGGGTAIFGAGQAITVTSAAANANNNSMVATPGTASTQSYNFTTLYFRVGTAQGSAATADVQIELVPVY